MQSNSITPLLASLLTVSQLTAAVGLIYGLGIIKKLFSWSLRRSIQQQTTSGIIAIYLPVCYVTFDMLQYTTRLLQNHKGM